MSESPWTSSVTSGYLMVEERGCDKQLLLNNHVFYQPQSEKMQHNDVVEEKICHQTTANLQRFVSQVHWKNKMFPTVRWAKKGAQGSGFWRFPPESLRQVISVLAASDQNRRSV